MIVFDIETGPLPLGDIRHLMPDFSELSREFSPEQVKVGNLKDPVKIQEKIAAARAEHEAWQAGAEARRQAAEEDWYAAAALSPMTGQVLALGSTDDGDNVFVWCCKNAPDIDGLGTEAGIITAFWESFQSSVEPYVGHNIFGFDLPFLMRRSFLLGVDVPQHVRKGRYWHANFVDTMEVWGCGSRDMIGLDLLAKACGLPGKMEGVNGADFARLLIDEPDTAIAYLVQDVLTTWRVAVRLQIA